jgi:hypothetical protein
MYKGLLDLPVEDLKLSTRATNALKHDGINVIGDLVQKTEKDLLKMVNMGKKQVSDIKKTLANHKVSLGMTGSLFKKKVKKNAAIPQEIKDICLSRAIVEIMRMQDRAEKLEGQIGRMRDELDMIIFRLNKLPEWLEKEHDI